MITKQERTKRKIEKLHLNPSSGKLEVDQPPKDMLAPSLQQHPSAIMPVNFKPSQVTPIHQPMTVGHEIPLGEQNIQINQKPKRRLQWTYSENMALVELLSDIKEILLRIEKK